MGSLTWGGKVENLSKKVHIKTESCDKDEEDNRSEVSSSVDGDSTSNVTAKKNVCDLACALLQLAQSIETKYLKKPLGTLFVFISHDLTI